MDEWHLPHLNDKRKQKKIKREFPVSIDFKSCKLGKSAHYKSSKKPPVDAPLYKRQLQIPEKKIKLNLF